MILKILLAALAGYLLGGCNGAIVISSVFLKDDVRGHGSGNAGLTNFYRAYGGPLTLLVIVIDLLKVMLACWIGGALLQSTGYLAEGQMLGGTAAIVGHMYPVYFRFHGGKGILSTAALAIYMDWRIFVVLFSIFLIVVIFTHYVSLGSILAAGLLPVAYCVCFWGHWFILLLSLVGWLDVVKHRKNIRRLFSGTESKFSFSKHKM